MGIKSLIAAKVAVLTSGTWKFQADVMLYYSNLDFTLSLFGTNRKCCENRETLLFVLMIFVFNYKPISPPQSGTTIFKSRLGRKVGRFNMGVTGKIFQASASLNYSNLDFI